jgi:hypothetical protein
LNAVALRPVRVVEGARQLVRGQKAQVSDFMGRFPGWGESVETARSAGDAAIQQPDRAIDPVAGPGNDLQARTVRGKFAA